MAEGVELLFGPVLIGVFLNCILYGAMMVQTLVYFQTYKRDPRWFKMLVYYLLFIETLNTLCDIGMIYEPLIIRYGTPRAVTVAPIMIIADPILTVLVSTPVQLFVSWRIKVMSKSNIVPVVVCFLGISSFIGGIATGISVAIINEYANFHKFDGAPITWLGSSAAADILITASLVYNLSRKRTGFAATDDLINKIIRLTVQTGLITAVFASLDITLFLTMKGTTLNFIWDLALSKLYSNSLLSTLNARGGWKATSTIRDNVLFGNGSDGESAVRSHTQIEFVTVDPRMGRPSSVIPMKVYDRGTDYHDQSTSNVTPKFMVDV